jgi:deoxyribonuclease IV
MKKRLLYGAHMSVAGGFDQAVLAGESINCTTIQIFTKSNRQWKGKPITEHEITQFQQALKNSSIDPVVAHSSYLINIGSPNNEITEKSIIAVLDELQRCALLQIPFLVLHPGSRINQSIDQCLETIIKNLDIILSQDKGITTILLEIMAGQGSTVCYNFEQLAHIIKTIRHKKRIGVCFDTCHAWAAGYDFSNKEKYELMWQQFDTIIGLDKLKIIHMNDSKSGCGSFVDRHETIGKGSIGFEAFSLIMNDERFFDVPKILETPKESLEDDVRNMNALKATLTAATRKKLGE